MPEKSTSKSKNKPTKKSPPAKKVQQRILPMDVVVGLTATVLIIGGLWFNVSRQPDRNPVDCAEPGTAHSVELQSDSFKPDKLDIQRCDIVVVNNTGNQSYDLSFGNHDKHEDYPGFSRQLLSPDQYFELYAVKSGSFTLHDHTGNKAYLRLNISK